MKILQKLIITLLGLQCSVELFFFFDHGKVILK